MLNSNADVMVLNDIIEQAAGRQSKQSDRGKYLNYFIKTYFRSLVYTQFHLLLFIQSFYF
jgi:hypothetical protein